MTSCRVADITWCYCSGWVDGKGRELAIPLCCCGRETSFCPFTLPFRRSLQSVPSVMLSLCNFQIWLAFDNILEPLRQWMWRRMLQAFASLEMPDCHQLLNYSHSINYKTRVRSFFKLCRLCRSFSCVICHHFFQKLYHCALVCSGMKRSIRCHKNFVGVCKLMHPNYFQIDTLSRWPFVDLLRCSIAWSTPICVNGIWLLVFTANSPLVKLWHCSGSDVFMASIHVMNSGIFWA